MKRSVFSYAILLFFIFGSTPGRALPASDWGPISCGAELAISTTNLFFKAGTTAKIHAKIKNSSTNFFYVVIVNEHSDFSVWLTNTAGEKVNLTSDPPNVFWRQFARKVAPGKVYETDVPLVIPNGVKVGSFKMEATREILIPNLADENKNHLCELTANTLEVKVK